MEDVCQWFKQSTYLGLQKNYFMDRFPIFVGGPQMRVLCNIFVIIEL